MAKEQKKYKNPFARGADTAPATVGGNYITKPGSYDFTILDLTLKEGGYKGDSFIAELQVDKAEKTGETGEAGTHKPGESRSYVRNLKSDFMYELMMAFMYAVGECTGDDLYSMEQDDIEKFLEQCMDKDQPCRGVRIHGDAFYTQTADKRTILALKWSGIEQSDEDIAKRRKELG